jgi:hypothetical protein
MLEQYFSRQGGDFMTSLPLRSFISAVTLFLTSIPGYDVEICLCFPASGVEEIHSIDIARNGIAVGRFFNGNILLLRSQHSESKFNTAALLC